MGPSPSRVRSALVISFLTLLASGGHAQSNPAPKAEGGQARPVLKANTRLVVVDVVATDSKGVPLANLKKEDFTMLEDGVAQQIASFSFQYSSGSAQESISLSPNVFSNVPARSTSGMNVILLDGLNGEFATRAYALEELIKFLEGQGSIRPTAIYVLGKKLKLLHDFTRDTHALREALKGFTPQAPLRMNSVEANASPYTQQGDFSMSERNIQATLQGLNTLAQVLAGYPGRKNLLWLSEAFPVVLFPEESLMSPSAMIISRNPGGPETKGESMSVAPGGVMGAKVDIRADYLALVKRVADALMNAQVAVYPLDAAGVGKISRLNALSTMRTMAERTGGMTYANQNSLVHSIEASLDDGATYYTLAYYPDNKTWDGRFRRIEVKTSEPGTKLRYRQGYYARDPGQDPAKGVDNKKLSMEITQALALDVPSATAVLFRATVSPPAEKGQKVLVKFEIDPHTLKFDETSDGVEHASVSCALVAFSGKGSPVKEELNNMTAKIQPSEFPKLMRASFPCQVTTELNSGNYTLRLGVVDRNSRLIGTTTAQVTVP
jgi:VWFA-related protein